MLPILKLPTPSLRERSLEIDHEVLLSNEIQAFIKKMIPTMYMADGVGLAAPQVGNNIRLCVIGKAALTKKIKILSGKIPLDKDLVLVNPIWTKISRRINWDIEGCLSVLKVYGKVKRLSDILVESWNNQGEELRFEAHDFFARVIQHEVDHLNGILFIDKASELYEVTEEELAANRAAIKAKREL